VSWPIDMSYSIADDEPDDRDEAMDMLNAACLNGTCGCGPWMGCKVADAVWAERDAATARAAAPTNHPIAIKGEKGS